MASISSLFVELKLSAESFNNGLKEAQREAKEFEKNLKPTLTVTKDLGLAMTAAGGAIVAGMAAASKAAIDYGDSLNDARQRTGRTVEELAKLGFAAEQSGASFDDLSRGLAFLAKNSKATTQDLNVIADTFARMEDGPQKAKLAFDLFGKSGQALIPLLNEGSAGIRKLGDEAQKAGLVISQDFASASDELNDTLNEVKASALGASVGIAQALLPTLQSAATFAADAGRQFAAFTKEHPQLVQATAALGAALLTLGSALTAIAIILPKVQAAFVLLGGAMNVFAGVAVIAAVAAIAAMVKGLYDLHKAEQNLIASAEERTKSLNKSTEALKQHSIALNLEGKTTDEQTQAIAKAGKELQAKLRSTQTATVATKEHTRVIVDDGKALIVNVDALKKQKDTQELASKAMRIALDLRIQDATLLPQLTKLQFDFNDALKEGGEAAVRAARDLGDFNSVVDEAVAAMDQASYNATQMQKDFDSISKTDPGVKIAAGIEEADKATVKLKSSFDDVKRTAANVFQEMFRDGEISFTKLGGVLRGVFETAASEILATMTAKLITPLVDKVTGALSSLLGGIPGLGGIFGGAAASAAGGAASAGGGATSSASSLASGATGILGGVIGGGIAAAGSLLGSARLEGTMNAVEFNTRATYIELRDTMDLILQPMKARLEDILAELYNHKYIPDILETIANRIGGAPSGVGTVSTQGGTSISINVFQNAGEDGAGFARRIAEELNRYVQFGGGRLIASGLNA